VRRETQGTGLRDDVGNVSRRSWRPGTIAAPLCWRSSTGPDVDPLSLGYEGTGTGGVGLLLS